MTPLPANSIKTTGLSSLEASNERRHRLDRNWSREIKLNLHGLLAISGEPEGGLGFFDWQSMGDQRRDIDESLSHQFDGGRIFVCEAESALHAEFLHGDLLQRNVG